MVTHSITGTLVGGVSKMTYPIIAILVSISAVSKSCLFLFADSQPCVSWTPECGLLHTFQEHHIQQAQKWSQDSKQAMNIASACKSAQRVIICVSSKFRKWMQGCVQPRSLGCLLFALFSHFKLDRGGSGGLCGMQLRMRACACVHARGRDGGGIGASHFTSGESRCCIFLELALRFRAVTVSVSSSEQPHAPACCVFLCFDSVTLLSEVGGELKPFVWARPWGTSRIPTRLSRARQSCSRFFRPKSSPPPEKACCLLLKW